MKLKLLFTTCFVLTVLAGWADEDIDQQDIGSESINQPAKSTPFSFTTFIDAVGPSKINNTFLKGSKVRYATSHVEGGMIVYYSPAYTEGAQVALSFSPTYIKWDENPYFDQEHFNTASFSLTGFSKRLDRWFWRSELTINFDAEEWTAPFTSYDLLLWGRYAYTNSIGIHLGFLAQTGLHLDRVYPVIGFDWQICRNLKLNLVYPVNVALDYSITPSWTLSLAGRFFNSRFRAHHNNHSHKPLVRYSNVGAEFAIKYQNDGLTANIHAGATLWGKYRVADRSNDHAITYKLDSAGYVGGEIDVTF